MKIKQEYHVPIYGILYKDDAREALNWLEHNGNPYIKIGNDVKGEVAIDFGVYGTPETYVISGNGKILYRQIGVIDNKILVETLLPLIREST